MSDGYGFKPDIYPTYNPSDDHHHDHHPHHGHHSHHHHDHHSHHHHDHNSHHHHDHHSHHHQHHQPSLHHISPPYNLPGYNQRGYYWVASRADHPHPAHAVVGGVDQDGSTIYVGRSFHDGDYIPAKVIPEKRVAYVAYGGQEHAKHEFEVLCEQRFEWVQSSSGQVPHNSVVGGRTSDGETLYIGRVYHDGSHTVGKVHPSHGCLYIPFGGEELKFDHYEILIML